VLPVASQDIGVVTTAGSAIVGAAAGGEGKGCGETAAGLGGAEPTAFFLVVNRDSTEDKFPVGRGAASQDDDNLGQDDSAATNLTVRVDDHPDLVCFG
jgi:hypothetical protein